MLYPFLVSPPKIPYPLPPPTAPQPTHSHSWPWHSPVLRRRMFTGSRASPSIDDCLAHPLLHRQLEPRVPPCVFFDWWFRPRELWGYWLFHIVSWKTVSIQCCICQALAEPRRRQLYQAAVRKILLVSAIVSGFGGCLWDGSPGVAVSVWSFL